MTGRKEPNPSAPKGIKRPTPPPPPPKEPSACTKALKLIDQIQEIIADQEAIDIKILGNITKGFATVKKEQDELKRALLDCEEILKQAADVFFNNGTMDMGTACRNSANRGRILLDKLT